MASRVPKKRTIHTPSVDEAVAEFKKKWPIGKYRYMVFVVDKPPVEGEENGGKLVLFNSGASSDGFAEFAASVPHDRYSFAILNFTFRVQGGGVRVKQTFFSCIPFTIGVEDRMVGNMLGGIFRGQLDEFSKSTFVVQIDDVSDLDAMEVLQKVSKYELDPIDYEYTVCID